MEKEKIESRLLFTIEKYKKHFDVFQNINIESLPFSILDKEFLEDNGIFLISDLLTFDFSKLAHKYSYRSRILHIDKILNQYFYRYFFNDISNIDFLERIDRRLARIRTLPQDYLSLDISKAFNISVRLYNCLKNASIYNLLI